MIPKIVGFEHLHRHSDYSVLDGFATVEEYGLYSPKVNQKYLAISDHGMLAAVPKQIKVCDAICDKYNDKNKLKPIYAIELYVNKNQPVVSCLEDMRVHLDGANEHDRKALMESAHLLAIAYTDQGYKNLVYLSSWAHVNGFYRKPRVNYEQLKAHKEGIIFTSCCYASEVGKAFEKGGEDLAYAKIEEYMEMFGENFYLEIMMLDFVKQKPYDKFIIKAKEKYHLPIIISNDCHYCFKEDSKFQRYMLMMQTKKTLKDIEKLKAENADLFELQDENLWMKSEEELNDFWVRKYQDTIPYEIFCEAKETTVKICEMAKNVQIDRTIKLPEIPNANQILQEETIKGFKRRRLPSNKVYAARLKEELGLIKRKGFSSYFLIQKKATDEARRIAPQLLGFGDGSNAVGPARGSGGGALVCYCLGLTDINPIKHDLMFSRFLSEARGGKTTKLRFKDVDPIGLND